MPELSTLFNPRSVVLVGATDRSTWSKMAFDNLRLLGFQGRVHLVSRSGGSAHGQPTFTSVMEIGEPVDVALLMLPIAAMNDALRDLGAAGITSAVVLAGGFAETGPEGRALQDEMVATARSLGIRLLGPNCLGFINFNTGGVCWTGSMRTPPLKGGISIVSQSGAVATVMKHFAHQHGIGLNVVAATGNEAVLGLADVVDYLVDDPATRVITVFAESVRDTALLTHAARRALRVGKPIVLLKVGRSEITVQAAQSHTGSLVGDDSVFDGVCQQLGLVRVRSIEELMFTAALLEKTGVLQGEGVAVLSASGGMGELAADYADLEGVDLPRLAAGTLAALSSTLPPMATPANPLDLTGAVVNKPELFLDCMQALEQDPAVSVLVCVFDVPTDLNNDWAPFAVGSLQAIGRFKPEGRVRFLAISNTVKYVSDRSRAEVEAGLPFGVRNALADRQCVLLLPCELGLHARRMPARVQLHQLFQQLHELPAFFGRQGAQQHVAAFVRGAVGGFQHAQTFRCQEEQAGAPVVRVDLAHHEALGLEPVDHARHRGAVVVDQRGQARGVQAGRIVDRHEGGELDRREVQRREVLRHDRHGELVRAAQEEARGPAHLLDVCDGHGGSVRAGLRFVIDEYIIHATHIWSTKRTSQP